MLRAIVKKSVEIGKTRVEAVRVMSARGASSLGGLRGYDEKENAEENIFFRKEDEKLLKELLSKVRAQAEMHDTHSATGVRAAEMSALNEIVGSKLNDAEKEALMQWKHTHF